MNEPKKEIVKVYDFKTKTVTTIPAAELAPGMIRIRISGSEEVLWADASQMSDATSQYWHSPFSGELKEKIVFIQRALSDVYFQTIESWEDGFRQDLHAIQEIDLWFRVAMLYSSFVETHRLNREQKNEAFSVLGACLNGTRNTVFQTISLSSLSRVLAEELANDYFS